MSEARTPGIWLIDGSAMPANGPEGISPTMGFVEVFSRYSVIFQRVTTYYGDMALRVMAISGAWGPWKNFIGT